MMTPQRFFFTSVGAVLICTGAANAGLFFVDFTSAGQGTSGNVGLSYRPVDVNGDFAPLLVTARAAIDDSLPFDPFASGSLGTVFIDTRGAGVQDEFGGGSKEISGGGPLRDEELILTFDAAVPRDDLVLGLTKYDPGNGLLNRDDPAIFVFFDDGTFATFDESDVVAGGGELGTLFLNDLLPEDAMVTQIIVRETNSHLLLGSVQGIPTPGALTLLGLGALAQRRRRRSA